MIPTVVRPALALALLASASAAAGQTAPARDAALRLVVADQSGAVIPGASVTLLPLEPRGAAVETKTDDRGEATFASLTPGRYSVRADFPGFDSRQFEDLRLRSGTTRRELRLPIARLSQDVEVGQDPRQRALDPKGNAFGNVLSREQIEALPDDPDDMEEALKQMAGPGAVIRVDGFRGGKLPPKSQIRGIRFRRDMMAAENHGGGMIFVDITTNPGAGPLRGTADFTFRDESLNARNPFSPVEGAEQQQNYGFTLNGTLLKDRTSFAITSNGTNSYDSQTVYAAVPGETVAGPVRRPNDRGTFTARLDHALSKSTLLKASFQRSATDVENLGVGDFNLPSRAYSRDTTENLFRTLVTGPIGQKVYAETRFQIRQQTSDSKSLTNLPAITVLDAFSAGGAQVAGGRRSTDLEIASDVDYANGRHAARFGFLFEGGRYRSDEVRNAGGTFTFASLDAYEADIPTTFTQRRGDPLVTYGTAQLGWYAQDDIRVARTVSLSLGLRQEIQAHMDDKFNLGPRASLTWSPFKSGATTIRGGAGIFYDWYDAQTYEQVLRVDGERQSDLTIQNPGYPNPFDGGNVVVLPGGRIVAADDLSQPTTTRANIGVEQAIGKYTRVNAIYAVGRAKYQLRGHDINAPLADGTRPDPGSGTVTQVESTARAESQMLHVGLNANLPWHRTFLFVNYTLGSAKNESDTAFSLPADNFDLAAEWGPSPQDARHRVSAMLNMNLWAGFKLATTVNTSTGLPYNITTGFDDNGDTVSNDRPAGVSRNSARGDGRWEVGGRLSWSFGFGQRSAGGGGTPVIMVRTLGGPADSSMGGFSGGADDKRWRFEIYLAGTNLANHMNPLAYSGVMTSPFFGDPTSSSAPRKLEIGTRFSF